MMKADPRISTRQIADALGIDGRNAESHIRALKKMGLIEREGAKKKGHWVVKPPTSAE
jgi:predicted HTH transcriptional regulator